MSSLVIGAYYQIRKDYRKQAFASNVFFGIECASLFTQMLSMMLVLVFDKAKYGCLALFQTGVFIVCIAFVCTLYFCRLLITLDVHIQTMESMPIHVSRRHSCSTVMGKKDQLVKAYPRVSRLGSVTSSLRLKDNQNPLHGLNKSLFRPRGFSQSVKPGSFSKEDSFMEKRHKSFDSGSRVKSAEHTGISLDGSHSRQKPNLSATFSVIKWPSLSPSMNAQNPVIEEDNIRSPKHLEAHAERRKRIQFTRESVKPTIEASPEGQPEEPGMKYQLNKSFTDDSKSGNVEMISIATDKQHEALEEKNPQISKLEIPRQILAINQPKRDSKEKKVSSPVFDSSDPLQGSVRKLNFLVVSLVVFSVISTPLIIAYGIEVREGEKGSGRGKKS
ncbi:hypothetical protein AAMO2058_001757400 [Amorphochlora amoebiformis]